jgi:hypothetical protein
MAQKKEENNQHGFLGKLHLKIKVLKGISPKGNNRGGATPSKKRWLISHRPYEF